MQQPTKITPKLNEKQKLALKVLTDHSNGISEVLFGGAAGGSKTWTGCFWVIACANKYPGTRWLIGGKELKKLKQTTMKSFFEVCKKLSIVEGDHYTYNEMKGEVKWKNGSEIILMDLANQPSDPEFEFLGSLEVAGAFIDEAARISEKAKDIVMTRIRHRLDEYGLTPKMLMTCNPTRNWCYNKYYKKAIDGTLEPYKMFIQSLSSDNPDISQHYINSLKRMDEVTKSRLLYGSWDYQDDLALFNYDALDNMFVEQIQENPDETQTKVFSIDVAHLGKDKTAIIVWNNLNIIHIEELTKQTFPSQQAAIQALQYRFGVMNSEIVMDLDGLSAGLYDLIPGCTGIHNNAKALYGEDFQNLKTQLYYKLADCINNGEIKVKCDNDQRTRLMQELQVIKREKVDSDGKIQMTSKDTVKRLISRSPDLSDAMAFRMYWVLSSQAFDYSFYVR